MSFPNCPSSVLNREVSLYVNQDFITASRLFDFGCFHSNFSDVVLISEDGKRFHAHRLVLCAQSAVFKAMMASQEWGTNKRSEVSSVCVGGGGGGRMGEVRPGHKTESSSSAT